MLQQIRINYIFFLTNVIDLHFMYWICERRFSRFIVVLREQVLEQREMSPLDHVLGCSVRVYITN